MSKNANGYMGAQVGKLGPAVGFMWKGRNVYRAYNPFVKNPNTEKQQLSRAIFKAVVDLSNRFAVAINHGYKQKANNEQTTTRGLFTKDNRPFVHANTVDSISVDVPAYWNGMKVHVYGFTVSADTNKKYLGRVSDSTYIGTGNIG